MSLISNFVDFLKNRQFGCYIISEHPLVITTFWHDFIMNYEPLRRILPKDVDVWFVFASGWYRSEEATQEIKDIAAKYQQQCPNYHFWFLNNSIEEHNYFEIVGLKTYFINNNIFLDENRYKIINRKKQYDAMYLARFSPFKRQHLAKNIKKLLLIGSKKDDEMEYYEKTRATLRHAAYREKIWGWEVSSYMNKAHVGLCLSEIEGSVYACTEYLLSGIPIVSTKSKGGRDVFFNGDYAVIADADPDAIAHEVYKLIAHPISPQHIRDEAIKLMVAHRKLFVNLIQEIFVQQNVNRDFSKEWDTIFIHKMGLRSRVPYQVFKSNIVSANSKFTE